MEIEFTYDEEANAAYVELAPSYQGERQRQVWASADGLGFDIILDIDPDGRMLGIEVLGAREAFREEILGAASPTPES